MRRYYLNSIGTLSKDVIYTYGYIANKTSEIYWDEPKLIIRACSKLSYTLTTSLGYIVEKRFPLITIHFNPLDQTIPPVCYAIVLALPVELSQRDHVLGTLQDAYSRLLQERPYLAGDIVRVNSPEMRRGSLKSAIPDSPINIKLDVADLSGSLGFKGNSFTGMPPSLLNAKLLAPGRVNWLEGSCLLAVSASHAVFDADGSFAVIKQLAQLCQSSESSSDVRSAPLGQQREIVSSSTMSRLPILNKNSLKKPYEDLKLRPELWNFLGLHSESNMTLPPNLNSLPTWILSAPAEIPGDAATLKTAASPQHGKYWISTKDAYSAHIWISLTRARFVENGILHTDGHINGELALSSMNIVIDDRKILECGFAPSRINNSVYCCQPQLPLFTILERGNLSLLAGLISDSNALAASIPEVGNITFVFKDFMDIDFVITSWTTLRYYDLDFGPILGKAEFMRMPNRGVEVVISARDDEMERLLNSTQFLKYAKLVCE
ncbi:hypothetical protein F4678DRAFT_483177 [Xylaria arbuscula]|nr:hypothetical protein F4678DRAFT_483177 [Xylaria arbuscula]